MFSYFFTACSEREPEKIYGIEIGGRVLSTPDLEEYSNISRYSYKGLSYLRYFRLYNPDDSEVSILKDYARYKVLSQMTEIESLNGIVSAISIKKYLSSDEREGLINEITTRLGDPKINRGAYFFQRGIFNTNQMLYRANITYNPEIYVVLEKTKYYRTELSAETKFYTESKKNELFLKGVDAVADDFF